MSDIENGGPDFPKTGRVSSENRRMEDGQVGMTMRDYFAAKAMLGMSSNPELMAIVTQGSIVNGSAFDLMAKKAYEVADAMLRNRSQS